MKLFLHLLWPLLVVAIVGTTTTDAAATPTQKRDLQHNGLVRPRSVAADTMSGNMSTSSSLKKKATVSLLLQNIPRAGALAVENKNLVNAVAGAVAFGLFEKAVKMGLAANNIKYPASLGACIILFVFMCLADVVAPNVANTIFQALTPGAAILAKWFPVFFVPGLAMLPLSPRIGGPLDIFKVIVTIIIGFVYSMTSTLFGVTTVRSMQGKEPMVETAAAAVSEVAATKRGRRANRFAPAPTSPPPPPRPFTDAQWNFCWMGSIVTGILSVAATKMDSDLAPPLQMVFTFLLTIGSYIWGTRLPAGFVKVVHPLVTSSVVLLLLIRGLAYILGQDFLKILATYKTGSLNPMKAGAGDYLLFTLGPSVVSFAVSVYSRKNLLFQNLPMVLTAMLISSAGGLYATGAFVRLLQLGGGQSNAAMVRLSVLARNVTTALAMALTDMVGGDLSIISAVVVLTGIIGSSYGKPFLNWLGVKDPICRGLAMGSSAQGLGVASISDEPDAFPFAAIAMVLTAISATTLVSFEGAREALIRVTTGAALKAKEVPI